MIIPDFNKYDEDEKKILYSSRLGAFIRDPISGLHKWVGSFDANSLYPSIIRTLNIGFETVLTVSQLPFKFRDFIYGLDLNVWEYYGNHDKKIKDYVKEYETKTGNTVSRNICDILRIGRDKIYEMGNANNDDNKKTVSLYKEIMRATVDLIIDKNIFEILLPFLKKYNLSVAPNFVFFKNDTMSILNKCMTRYYTNRKLYQAKQEECIVEIKNCKTLLKQCDDKKTKQKLKDEIETWTLESTNNLESSTLYKLLINSGYGAISHPSCRYFNVDCTNAITSTSQYLMKRCAIDINNFIMDETKVKKDHLIYGDTDSIYVDFEYAYKGDVPQMIEYLKGFQVKVESSFTKTVQQMNAFDSNILKMKIEKLADSTFFQKRKKYVTRNVYKDGVFYEDKKITYTGLSIDNINTPYIVTEWLEDIVKCYLDNDQTRFINYLDDIKNKIKNTDIRDISPRKNLNLYDKYVVNSGKKDKVFYGSNYELKPKCQPTIRGCAYHNYLIEKGVISNLYKLSDGDKVIVIHLKKGRFNDTVICFGENEPIEIDKNLIDYDMMFEKAILSNIEPFQEILKWSTKKSKFDRFNDMFGVQ